MNENKKNLFFTYDELKESFPVEQHLHTSFTDGANTPEEIIENAMEKGIKRIVFTEHVQRSSSWYKRFIKVLNDLKLKYENRITICAGIEAKMINLEGEIDATDSQKDLAEIIMGSVHGYLKGEKELEYYEFEELGAKKGLELEFKQTLLMIKNHKQYGINVIGHPFGKFISNYDIRVPYKYWEEIISLIRDVNLAFDLNFLYHKDYFGEILELAEQYQVKLNVGSDAHNLGDIGKCYSQIKAIYI